MTDTRRDRDHSAELEELTHGDDELDVMGEDGAEPVSVGGAISVLRRGIAASPELKRGLIFTIAMAVASSVGKLSIPLLVQQVIERGIEDGYNPGVVWALCGLGVGILILVAIASMVTMLRLLQNSEQMLYRLRVTAFAKIHSLSVADHNETRRGQLVARVTADIDTIARFTEWGMASWILNGVLITGTALVLLVLSWQLGLLVIAVFTVMLPVFRYLQRRQLAAYDILRDRVSDTLSEVSEAIGGGAVVRAYGLGPKTRTRLDRVVVRQYRAQMTTARYFALIFPIGDLFGTIALAVAVSAGVTWGDAWGLDAATLIAVLFLVTLIQGPIGELGEILDQTQTAISGWRKVLDVLDQPVDIVEPSPGVTLGSGPLAAVATGGSFRYRTGGDVLSDVDLTIDAGTSVAVVGATGSGKTTFVKLLARLADPSEGSITIGGVELADISPESRHASIRMVPQDGFLFDTTILENVSFGKTAGDATRSDVEAAFDQLGLAWWVDRLPDGLETEVGERGENMSVGERQLVALARAQLADPGLLILDEATSAVDPETDQALTDALARLAAGRTMISVAHRLSTAEQADLVVVFDAGRITEVGSHAELVAGAGIYGRLHDTWLGNTSSG